MAIIANAEAKRKLRERINSISTILETADPTTNLNKELYNELNRAQSEYIALMYKDDPKFPTAQEAKRHEFQAELTQSEQIEKIREDFNLNNPKPDPKEVKEKWVKTHEWRTPWRRDFDLMKREDEIKKRAEELFNMSGIKGHLMKIFIDYARLDMLYKEVYEKYVPQLDIDEQEELDALEVEQLSASLSKNFSTTPSTKSTYGPKPDPAI
jgi:hypothetical protein